MVAQEPILRLPSYNAGVVKIYSATSSLVRFEIKKPLFFEKRSSLLQRWRCSCKVQSRKLGSRPGSEPGIFWFFIYFFIKLPLTHNFKLLSPKGSKLSDLAQHSTAAFAQKIMKLLLLKIAHARIINCDAADLEAVDVGVVDGRNFVAKREDPGVDLMNQLRP
jgi:hypothetical protein